ncbi:MAG: hypothetical protein K6F53_00735 [Lachnospiraceae bacterium]|nr:hypothetical protein [Lachnospiraceae bacterium]
MATSSTIERLIEEIEDYIDGCKFQMLSNNKIIVNKDEIDELIRELKSKTPEELKRYKKVVANQQEILNDAKKKAQALMDSAEARSNEMISQNAIMKQAYEQADEVVNTAMAQAQDILNQATEEANMLKKATNEYVDGLLASYESLVSQTMQTTETTLGSFYTQLNQYYETVVANRFELNPPQNDTGDIPLEPVSYVENTGEIHSATGPLQDGTFPLDADEISESAFATANLPQSDDGSTGDLKLDLL